jgi:tRNA threonylcarbamoyladenosine biosynthesis protein TsaB
MSYILNIDTATEAAHVSVAQNGIIIHQLANHIQKDHAAFVQPAVEALIKTAGISFNDVAAIAVTAGPGSYTGLRVGMASAKGLCFALNKPLIAISTLETMAKAAIMQQNDASILYCPMIDARRMEVFTAIYNHQLQQITPPQALILHQNALQPTLQHYKILFFGSGAPKWKALQTNNPQALFTSTDLLPQALAALSMSYYNSSHFFDVAYTEPFYIKEFKDNT